MSNISIIQGHILEDFANKKFDILGHCCNCFHTMGKGIAKEIAMRYPGAYDADKATLCGDKDKLGTFSKADVGHQWILNLYGQYRYGSGQRFLSYDAIAAALKASAEFADLMRLKTLAFPYKMGCNNAGGNWDIVLPIITDAFSHYQFLNVTIYVP